MRRLTILTVGDIIFSDAESGSGRVIIEVSKSLVKRGHNVSILIRRINKGLPEQEEIGRVRIYRYNTSSINILTFIISYLINVFRTFNHISKQKTFDLIIFHHPLSALSINLSKKAQNIPKIYTFHSSWPEEYEIKTNKKGIGFFIRRWIEKKALNSCCKVVALSKYSKDKILNLYKGLSLDIEVIPGGIDIEKFKPSDDKDSIRSNLGIPRDRFVLLTIRDLTPRMGLENLITAMTQIADRYKNILLIIGGSGILESRLKQLAKELGLEKYIRFTGVIGDDSLPLYYQAADVFVLPTKCLEGFGLVTLEALACGTPVLGTPIGGTVEILKRLDEKFLFNGTDAGSIAKLIIEYIGNPKIKTDELRQKYRLFVVENYSWEKTASGLEDVVGAVKRYVEK